MFLVDYMEKIIKYFLEQEFSQLETEEQAGFRAGRFTIDHVFSLKQLIEKKKERRI